ncbi:PA0069 family radical SAM protein [Nevskia sp.]|uniref:PA0069 family radical SAM protein n=1 Tax=Nevskia sp. TaxID=1929292 RepID=UPI003F70E9EA
MLRKGRGAGSNEAGRFETQAVNKVDDGWDLAPESEASFQTIVSPVQAKSILTRNESPDIGFDQTINPYQGCEHGCNYCYARPSHGYLNLSAGLDFETRLFAKINAAEVLDAELRRRRYQPVFTMLGANTDCYQPIEKTYRITRQVLEVLARFRHPVGIITKGTLIERDLDLLADLARDRLVTVGITLTTLESGLKRTLEPRAASPAARLKVMRQLADIGVPVRVMFSPIIPFVNDAELEAVLEAGRDHGATSASYVLLRLPHEVKDLFRGWLDTHLPLKAAHVMSLVQQMRGGRDYDASFGTRMKGEGAFADLIRQRYRLATRRLGLDRPRFEPDISRFRVPSAGGQGQFEF